MSDTSPVPCCRGPFWCASVLFALALCSTLVCTEAKAQRPTTQPANAATLHETAHRELSCRKCHPQPLIDRFEDLQKQLNLPLDPGHDRVREKIELAENDRLLLHQRCRDCHRDEYDQWQRSGHAVTYAQVFLDRRHNKLQQLNDDCLRCHGLFFDGTIHDLVAPVNTQGPWRLLHPQLSDKPAILCLSCHQIHSRQYSVVSSEARHPQLISEHTGASPCGFYDRREKRFFAVSQLPTPRVREGDSEVEVASDERMRLCYQCHAPTVTHQRGSGDDRTLRGVHAGLSCFDCHQDHSLSALTSCADCHSAETNCGLDVRRMNTTYNAKASPHDIHTVRCEDCHADGVP